MSNPPTVVVISEGVVPALAIENDPKKSDVEFQSIADVDIADLDKNMSDLQQCEDNFLPPMPELPSR